MMLLFLLQEEKCLFGVFELSPSGKTFSGSPCHLLKNMLRVKIQTSGTYLQRIGKDRTKWSQQEMQVNSFNTDSTQMPYNEEMDDNPQQK